VEYFSVFNFSINIFFIRFSPPCATVRGCFVLQKSSVGLGDDVENAGGVWVDAPVVVDKGVITSRSPEDLIMFTKAIIETVGKMTGKLGG
jgi:hypothetical protein